MRNGMKVVMTEPPKLWEAQGIIMEHGPRGSFDMSVIGDPCVVWDTSLSTYRMYYFGQAHDDAGREINENCLAVAQSPTEIGRGMWEKRGVLPYTNREVIGTNGHKAFVVCDPYVGATYRTDDSCRNGLVQAEWTAYG